MLASRVSRLLCNNLICHLRLLNEILLGRPQADDFLSRTSAPR